MKLIPMIYNLLIVENFKMKCLIAVLFLTSFQCWGQRNYLFENISILEGLSNATVEHIFQDSNGFLWISTDDGLNRYDGKNIKVFKNDPNDSTTIPNNFCSAIVEDSDGSIWVGVIGNIIAKFDPKNETFKKYPIETGSVSNISYFFSAILDSKGNLWFSSSQHGIQKLNRSKNKFEQVQLESNQNIQWGEIHNITELKNGNILVADYGNGIKIYNEKLNLFQPYYLKTNFSPNEIHAIYEDGSGNLWFGGRNKLIKYSPSYYNTEDYDVFSLINNATNYDLIMGITQDDEGFLWVGIYSQGLYRIDLNTKAIQKFDFRSASEEIAERKVILQILKDKYGVIWICTLDHGLTKFDPLREPFNYYKLNSEEFTNSGLNSVTAIAGSQQTKETTIGTSSNGLFSYNIENNSSTNLKINFNKNTMPDGIVNIQSMAIDYNGNKWFTYNNLGLYKLDINNILTPIKSPYEKYTSNYSANDIKIDLSGNIWISSHYGFEKYNPNKNEFTLLPTIMTKNMSNNLKKMIDAIPQSREPIASILKVGEASNIEEKFSLDKDQKVLIIGVGEGRIVQGEDLFDKGSLLSIDGKVIWSMNHLSRTFNIGGGFKNRIAVECLDLKKGDYKITFASDVGHSFGTWNVVPPADSNWYGIQILSISDSEFKSISELNEQEIISDKFMPMEIGTCIELSKRMYNVLWLGSAYNSFFKYDLATGDFKQYNFDTKNRFSSNNVISSIFEDREGIVWISCATGLLRFDPMTEVIDRYNLNDGLPSNQINSIVEDTQGNLWINTSAGLSKLNKNAPQDKWNFVNYDTRDGLPGFTNSKANWISENGEIFLGSNDGVISFYPGKINEIKPDIVIEDIKISEVSLKSDSAAVKLEKSIMKLDRIDLSYLQNNISFEFASINFSRPEKNKINYKLEGFNNNWISTDRNFASFTNLNPGEYTFKVKGSNGDGIWNEEGKSIRLIISPPWWQTTMAYISYIFIFAGIVFGIDRVQRRRIVNKERNAAAINEANLRAQLAETENERKTKELEEARQLQLSMLPKDLPQLPHLDIAVYMKTATEVGGDYYDFHIGLDGTLTVVLGDATGHGMKAGTMVTTTKSLFNVLAPNPNIVETFHEMTRCLKLMQMEKLSMCLTMLKISGNKIQMSAAGMPPVFIYKRGSQTIEEHVIKGMPLGTFNDFPYSIVESDISIGDTILLMSDGFPELLNNEKEMYGYKRARNYFEEIAGETPENIISKLKTAGSEWVKDKDPDDDVTFVVIKVK
jgi:serine phosphatase RsbU (regulator of sigma subunit)/ligand-binding sensor domain-containing protein